MKFNTSKGEVPSDGRNSKVRKQNKVRREWSHYHTCQTSSRTLYIHEYNGFKWFQFQCILAIEQIKQKINLVWFCSGICNHHFSASNIQWCISFRVLNLSNSQEFENYLGQMYHIELEIKDTTESNISASYLDLLLSIGRDGQLHTSIYDKHDDFNFHITNYQFLSSNIPTSHAYGVFILQLIRYARACSSYGCFILRATRLSNKPLEQGYVKERLKSSLRKFYGRYGDQTIWSFPLTKWHSVTWPYTMTTAYSSDFVTNSTFYRILKGFHRTFATGVACRQGTLTPPDTRSRPIGTCIYSTWWDQSFFRTCRYLSGLCSSNIPPYFLDFAW